MSFTSVHRTMHMLKVNRNVVWTLEIIEFSIKLDRMSNYAVHLKTGSKETWRLINYSQTGIVIYPCKRQPRDAVNESSNCKLWSLSCFRLHSFWHPSTRTPIKYWAKYRTTQPSHLDESNHLCSIAWQLLSKIASMACPSMTTLMFCLDTGQSLHQSNNSEL